MLLRLVLYVDDSGAAFPLDSPCVQLFNRDDLYNFLAEILQRPPRVVFFWNFERNQYEPLTSLECLQACTPSGESGACVRDSASETVACLWVETRPLRLDPVDPEVDVDEYAELQAHVIRWTGNAHVSYTLQTALRVSDPCAARLFDHVRREELCGDSDDVELLYYTNNSLDCGEVLRNGFCLADPRPERLFVFSSSMLDSEARAPPAAGATKALLCEVAPGRAFAAEAPLWRAAAAPPAGYDSARHTARRGGHVSVGLRVSRDHQALARYVLTIRPASPERSRAVPSVAAQAYSALRGGAGGRSHLRPSRQVRAPQCVAHPGTALGLWCAQCAVLVCPYCAAVGSHRGHRVAGADAVADEARRRVQSLCHELSMRLDHYRRVRTQLAAEQTQLRVRVRDAARAMDAAFADIRRAVEERRRVCITRAKAQSLCLDTPLTEASRVVRKYEEAIAPLERAWSACGGTSVTYLAEVPQLMRAGAQFASETHDRALETAVAAAKKLRAKEERVLQLNCVGIRRRIERLGSISSSGEDDGDDNNNNNAIAGENGKSNGSSSGSYAEAGAIPLLDFTQCVSESRNCKRLARLSTSPGVSTPSHPSVSDKSSAPRPASGKVRTRAANDVSSDTASAEGRGREGGRGFVQRRRLADMRRGYIWCVHDATRHFHPDQRRAVCSQPFTLLGQRWELCIRAAAATRRKKETGNGTCDAAKEEPLGIFLYPVEHTQRMDFRIVLFSASVWAEWDVTGWDSDFAGKGWGVYPLLSRREMIQTDRLACDNTVKVCVVPSSALY